MNDQVFYLKIPNVCVGQLLTQSSQERVAKVWPVHIHSSPCGTIPKIQASLAFSPGSAKNFKPGTVVLVLVSMVWNTSAEKYINVDQTGSHTIIGKYHPGYIYDLTITNPNIDLEGDYTTFIDDINQAGMVISQSGAVRTVTSGRVVQEMCPAGDGLFENMHRTFAQNFFRVLSNQEPLNYCKEYFGTYFGADLNEKISNNAPDKIYMAYKRFITQSLRPDVFVSTNEGAYGPWIGPNNDFPISKGSEIIYNKIINHTNNRVTTHAGEKGPGFYTFRVDTSVLEPMTGEKLAPSGTSVTPIMADKVFYLGISEEGEILLEAAVDINPPKKPAMVLTIKKDGSVDLSVGKTFTINGKPLLTNDFLEFFTKHQKDLVQVTAIGAPAPMSPAAIPDFEAGKKPGKFLTDTASNALTSTAPNLKSTA